MIENNWIWLQKSNKALLDNYEEQEPRDPRHGWEGEPRCVTLSHEAKKTNLPDSYISPIYYHRQQLIGQQEPSEKDRLRLMVVGGTDGGHLLNKVLKEKLITHLVVIESNLKSFYHSLAITDWPAIFEEFDRREGTIYFHIGPVTQDIKQRIAKHLLDIGIHNAANIHTVYEDNATGKIAVKSVIQCVQECINSLGFFDDERVGLAHTVHKMQEKSRFFSEPVKPWIKKPVVVCGNGPSLTRIIPQIKKHRNQVFVISCGTAIGKLYEEDLKPDFHIEQERPKVTSNWTKLTTTPEFRDGITCIGLNVVHPQTHDLFKDIAYCLKSNDFGSNVAQLHFHAPQMMFVNPLVANAGLSIAMTLGFKHIYLAGVDCAYAKDGRSHAGKSAQGKVENRIEVAGNFRETVETTGLYLNSKRALEYAIENNPQAIVYNLCDGAWIAGARAEKKIKPKEHKPVTKDQIMAPFRIYEGGVDTDGMRQSFTANMSTLKTLINSIPEKIKGRDEAFFYIDKIHHHLLKMKSEAPQFWFLVKGTMATQLVFMAGFADSDLSSFDEGSQNLKELSEEMHKVISQKLFDFDDWEKNGELPEDVNG